jgi:hypothetical protein
MIEALLKDPQRIKPRMKFGGDISETENCKWFLPLCKKAVRSSGSSRLFFNFLGSSTAAT